MRSHRESVENWIRLNGPFKVQYSEAHLDMEGRNEPDDGCISGYFFRVPRPDGGYFEFTTRGKSHIQKEMLIRHESKAIAKEAPDPKTPKKTLKTRKDIV